MLKSFSSNVFLHFQYNSLNLLANKIQTIKYADLDGMDGDSVQLEEETHEAVEAKIDQDLTQTCLDTRHFLAT